MALRKFLIIFFIFSSVAVNGGFFYARANAMSAGNSVVITEIMYDPSGGDTNHEWAELYNAGAESVTLTGGSGADGWRVFDGANHIFATSTVLGAGDYLVLAQDSAQFFKDYPLFTGALIQSSFILDNTNGRVALRVGSNGALWSDIQYASAWGGDGNSYTLAKKHALGSNTVDEWAQSASVGGTPGAPNTFVETISTSSTSTSSGINQNTSSGALALTPVATNAQTENNTPSSGEGRAATIFFINEIYPAPSTGEKEWVELYNPNTAAVDLAGWKLADNSSTTTLYGTINAGKFVYWEFKGVLNNEGDVITLYRPDNSLADKLIYGDWRGSVLPAPENGQSLARFPDGASTGNLLYDFFLTTTPTRAGANKINAPSDSAKKTEPDTRTPSRDRINGVEFSEVLPNPVGPDDAPHGEFIELVNRATSTVDISGYRVDFGEQKYRVASGTVVDAGQFAALYRDQTRIFLSNEKGTINLMDAHSTLIDRMKYEDAEAGISINRVSGGNDKWEFSSVLTPGTDNRVVSPNHPPEPIMSIEGDLFPGNQLWFDASDSYDADGDALSFIWIFSDGARAKGRWVSHSFNDTRAHKVTLVVMDNHARARSITRQFKMEENYDGYFAEDGLATSTPEEFSSVKSGAVKTTISRTRANASLASKALKAATIAGTLSFEIGTRVSVSGVVVAAPGEFNAQTMYLAEPDDTISAVQVYMQKKTWPALKRGDSVQVEGEMGKAYGAARIKIKTAGDVEVLGHNVSIEPLRAAAAEVPTGIGAALVSVEGTIVDDMGGGFALVDESGQIALGLKRGAALPKSLVRLGDIARVTGIAVPAKNGMQILPRDAHDVEITGRDTLARAPFVKRFSNSIWWFGIITLSGVTCVGVVWWRLRRRGRIKTE